MIRKNDYGSVFSNPLQYFAYGCIRLLIKFIYNISIFRGEFGIVLRVPRIKELPEVVLYDINAIKYGHKNIPLLVFHKVADGQPPYLKYLSPLFEQFIHIICI